MKRTSKILVIVTCLAMILATACGGGSGSTDTSGSSGGSGGSDASGGSKTLRVGTTATQGGFNPWDGSTLNRTGKYLVFDPITLRVPEGDEEDGSTITIPWAAESKWIDDSTYEIKLRDDVYFNNGEQMIAEDVMWCLQKSATNEMSPPSQRASFEIIDFDASTIADDGLTLTLKLTKEYAPFEIALDDFPITDESSCEDWAPDDERWWDAPVASGPYEIVENVSGSQTTYKLREDYWNKDVSYAWDEIIVTYYQEASAMFIGFENGEFDVALGIGAEDAARLESGGVQNAGNITYRTIPDNAAYMLSLDYNKKELADPKVREAVANAIDYEAIGEVVYGGLYRPVDSIVMPVSPFYVSQGTYDKGLEYAKQCMAESAYPDGFDVHVTAMNTQQKTWEILQGSLSEIGINVAFETYDPGATMGMIVEQGSTDMMVQDIPGGDPTGDPSTILANFGENGQFPAGQVYDKEYNEHFTESMYTFSEEKRAEAYAWLQSWVYENVGFIPLCEPMECYAYNTDTVASADVYTMNLLQPQYIIPAE